MKDNLSFLVQQFLKKNAIIVDFDELNFQIQSHPSYPSLHAITGVLSHLGIENIAIQVPVTSETLVQLPNCFLGEIEDNGIKHFAVVLKLANHYQLVFNNKTTKPYSETLFQEQFTGIMVAVEKNETIASLNSKSYTNVIAAIVFVFFIFVFYSLMPTLTVALHFLLSILGIIVSYLIVQHDLGISSKLVDKICSQESKTNNCNAILNSKGSLLFKTIKLSDVCIIYFTAINISWFMLLLSNAAYSIIFGISLLAIPAIVYSVYYQYVVAKTWCQLCLAVVAILTLQVILTLMTIKTQIEFSKLYLSLLIILLVFVSTSAIWLFIVSKLKKEKKYNLLKIESTKFKRNYSIFKALLYKNDRIDTSITNLSEIVFGNLDSPLKLLIVTNPFCGFCKEVHNLVETLLKKNKEHVSITVRFNINADDQDNELVKITTRLLDIFHKEGQQSCLEAMHVIYNERNVNAWFKLFGICTESVQYQQVLIKEHEWCVKNQINFTPELFINGFVYPTEYENEDLLYFVEDLNEDMSNTVSGSLK